MDAIASCGGKSRKSAFSDIAHQVQGEEVEWRVQNQQKTGPRRPGCISGVDDRPDSKLSELPYRGTAHHREDGRFEHMLLRAQRLMNHPRRKLKCGTCTRPSSRGRHDADRGYHEGAAAGVRSTTPLSVQKGACWRSTSARSSPAGCGRMVLDTATPSRNLIRPPNTSTPVRTTNITANWVTPDQDRQGRRSLGEKFSIEVANQHGEARSGRSQAARSAGGVKLAGAPAAPQDLVAGRGRPPIELFWRRSMTPGQRRPRGLRRFWKKGPGSGARCS